MEYSKSLLRRGNISVLYTKGGQGRILAGKCSALLGLPVIFIHSASKLLLDLYSNTVMCMQGSCLGDELDGSDLVTRQNKI